MTVSMFDHPLLSGLLGDDETAKHFSIEAEFKAIEIFEVALVRASTEFGLVPHTAMTQIVEKLDRFAPDLMRLITASAQDGTIIPDLIAQMRDHIGEPDAQYLHLGATSQDVIDTSLVLRMSQVFSIFEKRLAVIVAALDAMVTKFSTRKVMARTRMQDAIEIRASDRLGVWREMMGQQLEQLPSIKKAFLRLQLGGAAGTRDQLQGKGPEIAGMMGKFLDIDGTNNVWHTDRSSIANLANYLSLVSGSLGKIGQDMAIMAQNDVDEITFADGGASSAMPHKRNPVGAEILVTLARFNGTLVSGIHQSLVHENERSGAAWTLEWLILPQMVVATGAALRHTESLLANIKSFGR